MNKNNKTKNLALRFKRDESGQFAMIWALCTLAALTAFGAAYDIASYTKVKVKGQNMADAMALSASVAINNNDTERLEEGVKYTYEDIVLGQADKGGQVGGDLDSNESPNGDNGDDGSNGQSGKPKSQLNIIGEIYYDLIDDKDPNNQNLAEGEEPSRLIARAKVEGAYSPAFMPLLGIKKDFTFSATSDVAYSVVGGQPASVFFAVDNSGSMGWNDSAGQNKLTSLKTSLRSFMTLLDGVNNTSNNIFRTSLVPYSQDYNDQRNGINSDGVIPSWTVSQKWGTLTDNQISRMSTLYGTDSSGAMEDLAEYFEDEDSAHFVANGEAEPLKYAIFMSDGSNNSSYECIEEEYTAYHDPEHWTYRLFREQECNGWGCWWESTTYPTTDIRTYHKNPRKYMINDRERNSIQYHPPANPYQDTRDVCSWDYHADRQTLESCQAMKDDGVTVYTIGYDLQADSNTSQAEVDRANDLLEQCASVGKNISASNGADLNEVFETIGEEIIEEVIRIKR